jgi:hypothetical protein
MVKFSRADAPTAESAWLLALGWAGSIPGDDDAMKKRFLLVAAALLVLALAVGVTELQEPPRHTPEPTAPLTDVAGPAPVVPVSTREEPPRRLAERPAPETATLAPVPEVPPTQVVAPSLMPDPAHPPQWTKPLALPSTPSPPDPSIPPPIAVDPERGRRPQEQ